MQFKIKTICFITSIFVSGLLLGVVLTLVVEKKIIEQAFTKLKDPLEKRVDRLVEHIRRKANLDQEQTDRARVIVLDILQRFEPKRNICFAGFSNSYNEMIERLTPILRKDQKIELPNIALIAGSLSNAVPEEFVNTDKDPDLVNK